MRTCSVVLILCLLAAIGCGRKSGEKLTEKIIESESGGEVSIDTEEGTIDIESKDGSFSMSTSRAAKIPDNFPKDVPVYKSAKPVSVMQMGASTTVTLMCGDDVETVAATYKKLMEDNGWGVSTTVDMGAQKITHYTKGERETAVTISEAENETVIGLVLTKQ